MRRLFAVGIVLVLAASSNQMVAQESNPEEEVRTTLKEVVNAALKSDTAALDQLLADDFTRIQGDGSVLSKTQVIEGLKTGTIKFVVFDEADAKIRLYGGVAVVVSTASIKMRSLDGNEFSGQFRNSRVFVKHGGNWRVVLFQSSKVS